MSCDQEEARQCAHFNRIASKYRCHYMDSWSLRYRYRFIDTNICHNLDLKTANVLDAMCGPGQLTGFLISKYASVNITGLDNSPETLAGYAQSHPSAKAVSASFLNNGFPNEAFDYVFIVGGLHHLHPYVDLAIQEVGRLLKPGGTFAFCEPHKAGCLDNLRRLWIRLDSMFEKNEGAIDLEILKDRFGEVFDFKMELYGGNIAYFLIYNSLILRIPHWLKSIIAPPLLILEGLIQAIQGRWLSAYTICQWRKKGGGHEPVSVRQIQKFCVW